MPSSSQFERLVASFLIQREMLIWLRRWVFEPFQTGNNVGPHMICRSELKRLQGQQDYPSISLLAPTHGRPPRTRRIGLSSRISCRGAGTALRRVQKARCRALVKNLNKLVNQVDWEHSLDGLALFAGREVATAFCFPSAREASVVIDATFATRDLVYTLNRSPRYRVLVLTEKPTRLFDATTNVLTEFTGKPFPLVHKGPGGASRLPGGQGINRSAVRG